MKKLAFTWVEGVLQAALAIVAVVIIGMVVVRDADAREDDRHHVAEDVEGNA